MAKSPKKPRRGGEHDPAVNTAAGAPSKGVSVDLAVNTAADAPSMGVAGANDGFGCVVLSHTVADFGAEEPEFHRRLEPAVRILACGHDWRRLIVCGLQNGAI